MFDEGFRTSERPSRQSLARRFAQIILVGWASDIGAARGPYCARFAIIAQRGPCLVAASPKWFGKHDLILVLPPPDLDTVAGTAASAAPYGAGTAVGAAGALGACGRAGGLFGGC